MDSDLKSKMEVLKSFDTIKQNIIQSLKQEYIELETEEIFHKDTKTQIGEGSFSFKMAEIPITLEIKTRRVDGQLMAYIVNK